MRSFPSLSVASFDFILDVGPCDVKRQQGSLPNLQQKTASIGADCPAHPALLTVQKREMMDILTGLCRQYCI